MGEEEGIICHTLSESPHSARGPVGKLLSTFYSLNWKDLHTRGGRGGKRGYSLRLFAYTGRFRLGLLSSIFSLFLGNFKHGPRQAFSQYWLHLSAFPLPSSIQAAWMGFPKRFPTHKSHISHRFKISPNLCYCRICVARTLLSLDKLVKKGGGKALVQRSGFGREL